ncbi:RNA recognition motif [Geosmithia morbida]|uniref:RNA recognition motif n=1 Tax=Geosmithia morbida TaxID=1094350 RepID=A0A9P4YWR9_9HYPO|nr:RNA recognition motif [Geosmithia morbida]KAF4122459.1 RNA recognition motif [Geosmithia morbida]
MSYPPPPGIGNLPARPPATTSSAPGFNSSKPSGFKPAFSASASPSPSPYAAAATTHGPFAPPTSYRPQQQQQQQQQQYGSQYPPYNAQRSYTPQQNYGPQSYGPQSYGPRQPPPSYGSGGGIGPTAAAPAIHNPFPAAAGTGSDFDPEMAAQIAHWQSAYGPRTGTEEENAAAHAAAQQAQDQAQAQADAQAVLDDPNRKKKTAVREGGGKKWTDDTLLEWDPSHLRLFVGNLAGETTDDSLLKAFARWTSVQKARVIRDKRTNKSKGYGFVSFSSADDFFAAARDMNGKYIQSHPVVVRKANTEIKVTNVKDKNKRNNGRNNNNNNNKRSGNGAGGGGAHGNGAHGAHDPPQLGPHSPAGVTKPGQRTKNGLKLLG